MILAPNMEPKCIQIEGKNVALAPSGSSGNALQIQLRFFVVVRGLWEPFALPLALFLIILGAFGVPLGAFGPQIGRQNLPKLQKRTPMPAETKNCQELAEIPPRTAENPPRTAENPPRTRPEPAVRTPNKKIFHITASTNRLRSPTDAPTKRLEQKWGGGAPPWGDFN